MQLYQLHLNLYSCSFHVNGKWVVKQLEIPFLCFKVSKCHKNSVQMALSLLAKCVCIIHVTDHAVMSLELKVQDVDMACYVSETRQLTFPLFIPQNHGVFSFTVHELTNVLMCLKNSIENFSSTQPMHLCMIRNVDKL